MDPEGVHLPTVLYTYGKPRLCINIHHWRSAAHRAAALQQAAAVQLHV